MILNFTEELQEFNHEKLISGFSTNQTILPLKLISYVNILRIYL